MRPAGLPPIEMSKYATVLGMVMVWCQEHSNDQNIRHATQLDGRWSQEKTDQSGARFWKFRRHSPCRVGPGSTTLKRIGRCRACIAEQSWECTALQEPFQTFAPFLPIAGRPADACGMLVTSPRNGMAAGNRGVISRSSICTGAVRFIKPLCMICQKVS